MMRKRGKLQNMSSTYLLLTLLLMMLLARVQAIYNDIDDNDNDNDNDNNSDADNISNMDQEDDDDGAANEIWPMNFLYFRRLPPIKLVQRPGKVLELVCNVVGKPLPTVKWVVGDYPVSELEKQDSNVVTKNKTDIYGKVRAKHIVDYTLHKPLMYTCVAQNGLRSLHTTTIVYPNTRHHFKDVKTIQQKEMRTLQKPKIIYHHMAHFDKIGSSVLLPCRVYARPAAKVSWLDRNFNEIQPNEHFKLLPTGDLIITELQMFDIGQFQCIARNALGMDTAKSSVYPLGS